MADESDNRIHDDIPKGMTKLFLGVLRKGPAWTPEATPEIMQAQREHLDLLRRLSKTGKLLMAGPIPEGEDWRGFVVCRAPSSEQAHGFFDQDTHIRTGRLVLKLYPWVVPTEILTQPLLRNPE